jgi:DNA-binding NarL/FixJ family response regulator
MSIHGRVRPTIVIGGVDDATSRRLRQAWQGINPSGESHTALDPADLVEQSSRLQPEFAVIAEAWLRLAGLDLLSKLSGTHHVGVMVCGEEPSALTVARGFGHGLRGVLAPGSSVETMTKALLTMRAGEMWISRRKLLEALHSVVPSNRGSDTWRRLPSLSEREHAVLTEVLAGLANKEIAEKLAISEHTVKAHLQHLYLKLGVHRRVDLLRACLAPQPP